MFECEQCKVWGFNRPPMTQEEAELHLLYVHPLRFYRVFKLNASEHHNDGYRMRDDITDALAARKE